MTTKWLFRNRNSQAVRIPAELAYERSDLEQKIERCGDELRIRPTDRPITGALESLAAFSPSFFGAGPRAGRAAGAGVAVSLRPLYVLDTNICRYLMKHQPPQVAERFSACRFGEVLIMAITVAELEYGVVASCANADRNSAALARFFLEVPVAPIDGAVARVYCPVRMASRERRGMPSTD
jgi:predicted nucleic acid-binding protein/virulence-associated protein VagC